jgi:hypothetical protein
MGLVPGFGAHAGRAAGDAWNRMPHPIAAVGRQPADVGRGHMAHGHAAPAAGGEGRDHLPRHAVGKLVAQQQRPRPRLGRQGKALALGHSDPGRAAAKIRIPQGMSRGRRPADQHRATRGGVVGHHGFQLADVLVGSDAAPPLPVRRDGAVVRRARGRISVRALGLRRGARPLRAATLQGRRRRSPGPGRPGAGALSGWHGMVRRGPAACPGIRPGGCRNAGRPARTRTQGPASASPQHPRCSALAP